jgi:hypothetical protein
VALAELACLSREESKEAEEQKPSKLGVPPVDDVERLQLVVDDLAIVDVQQHMVANLIAVDDTMKHKST